MSTTPKTKPYNEHPNLLGFAVIKNDGSVITWGSVYTDPSIENQLNGTIRATQIYSNSSAFAVLRADGSVITFSGENSGNVGTKLDGTIDVIKIFSTRDAFAALRSDGSVVTWDSDYSGGDSSYVMSKIDGTIDVTQIFTNDSAFAALRADGSVVTWGDNDAGGYSNTVSTKLDGTIDVIQIFSNNSAFAALRADGSVVTWGDSSGGGDSSKVNAKLDGGIDVTNIVSNSSAFAALRIDGSVVNWGDFSTGGNSGTQAPYQSKTNNLPNGLIETNHIVQIYSNTEAFAALRADGSVVTWGYSSTGGDSSRVATKLDGTIDVIKIFSTGYAFAALRSDGSVVTWGSDYSGGDSSDVMSKIDGTIDVTQIFANDSAFAALRADGSVVTWGDNDAGGYSRKIADKLDGVIDVIQIFSNDYAFAALRSDGSVVTWGDASSGGDNFNVSDRLDGTIDVTKIFSNSRHDSGTFAALRVDGSVVTWGDINSYSVANQLKSGVVSFADITTDDIYTALTNSLPTGNVIISGDATKNQTLTASNDLADPDGLGSISYSWLRDDVAITNATQSTYTLTQTDVGKKISVKAGYTDNAGSSESVTSVATSSVTNVNDAPKGSVTITGIVTQNQILKANNTLTDLDGLGTITYQWLSNNKEISNATQSTYKLSQSDVGNVISVKASYTDGFGTKENVTSSSTTKIGNVNDAPTGNVSISGLAAQGQTLTIVNTLADLDGLGTIKYQWLSNGAVISGATKSSYVLGGSDIGKTISVKASYTDLLGANESVTSQPTDVVISTKPSKGNDVLTGTAKNDTLSALAGNDILAGGLGADKLTGGLGTDIFKYTSIDDSGVAVKTRDTITDFKHSEGDKIDLSAIALPNDQAFTYIGTIAFSKDATAQLRLDPKTGILYGSTNADNTPEFSILLSGVKSLVPEDFVL